MGCERVGNTASRVTVLAVGNSISGLVRMAGLEYDCVRKEFLSLSIESESCLGDKQYVRVPRRYRCHSCYHAKD